MPFTHYPKLTWNLIACWVHPTPPDNGKLFLGQSVFSYLNKYTTELLPNKCSISYHDAQPFTRIYGSVACDQPLEVSFSFSNEEMDSYGNYICDDNISSLNYDAEALKHMYDPTKQSASGKYFVLIYGRWMRVCVQNTGINPASFVRVFVRGSVF